MNTDIAGLILLSLGALSIVAGACVARKRVRRRTVADRANRNFNRQTFAAWMEQNWRDN